MDFETFRRKLADVNQGPAREVEEVMRWFRIAPWYPSGKYRAGMTAEFPSDFYAENLNVAFALARQKWPFADGWGASERATGRCDASL